MLRSSTMVRSLSISIVKAAGGILLVLCGLALFPETAIATCGNYVTILGQSTAHHNMQDEQSPNVPCSGPGCSQLPAVPFTPIPAPIITSLDLKACVVQLDQAPPTDGERAIPNATDDRPVRMPSSIFHPPRVG